MSNFMITYSDKESELKNKINELKKLKFNTLDFEKRLNDLNSKFSKINEYSSGVSTQTIQESQFRVIVDLDDLERDIKKIFIYYNIIQSSNEISKRIIKKDNQTLEKLNMYSKELLSILNSLNKIKHTNYEYFKSTQSIVYSTIYELIKLELRLFDYSNTLDTYNKNGFNQSYLIELMNNDVTSINSQNNQKFILKENTVTPEGKLNILSLKELSIYDSEFINNLLEKLRKLDKIISAQANELTAYDNRMTNSKNNVKSATHNKKHSIKYLIKDSWSPILSFAILTTLITLPWTYKDTYYETSHMETKAVYDTINGMQTIKEYGIDEEGKTIIIDYGKTNSNNKRSKTITEITDNKETDPSKLLDIDIDDYKTNTYHGNHYEDANNTSIDTFRTISIVTAVDESDTQTEFLESDYILLSLLINAAGLLGWIAFIEIPLSNLFAIGFVDKHHYVLKNINAVIKSIEKSISANHVYKVDEKHYQQLLNKLNELKKVYNELYDKYDSLESTFENNKLVRK